MSAPGQLQKVYLRDQYEAAQRKKMQQGVIGAPWSEQQKQSYIAVRELQWHCKRVVEMTNNNGQWIKPVPVVLQSRI